MVGGYSEKAWDVHHQGQTRKNRITIQIELVLPLGREISWMTS